MSKVAIVTGSTRGIGREIAERFVDDGLRVVLNSARSVAAGEALERELPGTVYVHGDISEEAAAQRLVAVALERFGRLDVVVNNVGATRPLPPKDLSAVDDDFWREALSQNVMGPWYLSRAAAPALTETAGAIINIGSIAGIVATSSVPYSVSKAAVHHMTRTLAMALAPRVRVNAVAPGWIDTPRTEGIDTTSIIARTPLARIGTAGEIADAVSSLIGNTFVTGQVLVLDGGRTLG